MNVTEALQAMDDELDDAEQQNWPLAQRLRFLHRHEKGMIRQMAEHDTTFANFKFQIASGTEVSSSRYQYELPLDLDIIVAVREQATSSEQRKRPIPPHRRDDPTSGWHQSDRARLILSNNQNLALEVDAVKMPPPPYRGTIVEAFADGTGIHLETIVSATTSEFAVSQIANAYASQYFQVTGVDTADGTRIARGQVFRAATSAAAAVSGGIRVTLAIGPTLGVPLVAGDTLETVFQVAEKHARLLILRACRHCFQKKQNVDGIASIQRELDEENHAFMHTLTPRQKQAPASVNSSLSSRQFARDINTDSSYSYQ